MFVDVYKGNYIIRNIRPSGNHAYLAMSGEWCYYTSASKHSYHDWIRLTPYPIMCELKHHISIWNQDDYPFLIVEDIDDSKTMAYFRDSLEMTEAFLSYPDLFNEARITGIEP